MRRADPLRVVDYLEHVIEAIESIQEYTAGIDLTAYMADRKTCDAVIRNLEVISEACKKNDKKHPKFATEHSEILWGFAYEMRNALSHGYFPVDHAIVWQTIQQDLPKLQAQVAKLI